MDTRYLAGFFDGEGCVLISKNNVRKNPRYALVVTITNLDYRPLKFCMETWGGSVSMKKSSRLLYSWTVTSNKAKLFLTDLLPYLRTKQEQAALGILFQMGQYPKESAYLYMKSLKKKDFEWIIPT